MNAPQRRRLENHPLTWVSSTYFAEGFPYAIVHNLAEILFTELGASLKAIGLTALFHLPWNIKFLWGPILDRFGTKRQWILVLECVIAGLLAAFAALVHGGLATLTWLFALLAFLAATHDIAIDGFYLVGLDAKLQSRYVGARVTAYRIATLVASGGLLLAIDAMGWQAGFLIAAVYMLLIAGIHAGILPRAESPVEPFSHLPALALRPSALIGIAAGSGLLWAWRSGALPAVTMPEALAKWSLEDWIGLSLLASLSLGVAALPWLRRTLATSKGFYVAAFADFLDQPKIATVLAFVVLFRTGESFLLKMRYPFLKALGMTKAEYGFVTLGIGVAASFIGSIVGGALIARHGLRRWIWPFVLAQNLLNFLYVWLAASNATVIGHPELGRAPAGALAAVILADNFAGGLGTAVFTIYLMRLTKPDHRAAHMAILTAIMSVSYTLAGVASGFLAERMGYALYFAFTVLTTLPSMALIFAIPKLDEPPAEAAPA